jgi:predicted Zn-dependent protease
VEIIYLFKTTTSKIRALIARKSRMAKRRSREQIDADKIIKEYLNELGEKVVPASNGNKADTGRLQDEQNYNNPILF